MGEHSQCTGEGSRSLSGRQGHRERPLFAALLLLGLLCVQCTGGLAKRPTLRILFPIYFYPEGSDAAGWAQLGRLATQYRGRIEFWIIVNVNDGPDVARDPTYAAAMAALKRSGAKLLGYVPTGTGSCFTWFQKKHPGKPCPRIAPDEVSLPLLEIRRRVRNWIGLYGAASLDGIFFDEFLPYEAYPETAGGPQAIASVMQDYIALYNYTKTLQPGYRVFANPGYVDPRFASFKPRVADVVCAEGDSASIRASAKNDPTHFSLTAIPRPYGRALIVNTVPGARNSLASKSDITALVRLAYSWGVQYFIAVRTYGAYDADFFPSEVAQLLTLA